MDIKNNMMMSNDVSYMSNKSDLILANPKFSKRQFLPSLTKRFTFRTRNEDQKMKEFKQKVMKKKRFDYISKLLDFNQNLNDYLSDMCKNFNN